MLLLSVAALLFCLPMPGVAGPYPPAAEKAGSTAISRDNPAFTGWADDYTDYLPGDSLEPTWKTPENALGKAAGTSFDVVSLGRGGRIAMTFDPPISDGDGWDFAVFENAFSDDHLELAYVEVSSNGEDFVRFENTSLTPDPVESFGTVDPTLIHGLAGKYRQGFGTPFDLADLSEKEPVKNGTVDLSRITHIKLIDIVGDGSDTDSKGHVIYDPYPTTGSAGFDLDAIGVSNGAPYPDTGEDEDDGETPTEGPPEKEGEAGFGGEGGCFVTAIFD
ncbi:MAG: PEP-CTERM sorting domain-containing protein [Thermodesulfobacteriota bacterium]